MNRESEYKDVKWKAIRYFPIEEFRSDNDESILFFFLWIWNAKILKSVPELGRLLYG